MFKIYRLVALMFIPNNNPEVNNIVNHIDGDKNNNLVVEHFLDVIPNKDFILHINHDKSDNRVENLKRATLSEVNYHSKNI